MKKFNKNLALCIVAALVVIGGMASKSFVFGLKDTAFAFFNDIRYTIVRALNKNLS